MQTKKTCGASNARSVAKTENQDANRIVCLKAEGIYGIFYFAYSSTVRVKSHPMESTPRRGERRRRLILTSGVLVSEAIGSA